MGHCSGVFTLWTGSQAGGTGIIIALIVAPVGALIFVVATRLYLEVVLVLFKISESAQNIEHLLQAMNGDSAPRDLGAN